MPSFNLCNPFLMRNGGLDGHDFEVRKAGERGPTARRIEAQKVRLFTRYLTVHQLQYQFRQITPSCVLICRLGVNINIRVSIQTSKESALILIRSDFRIS